jgi:glycerol dehydrogenase-like iron-containing ADH family enzyme
MFENISSELLQRAMQPPVTYGRHILAQTLRQVQTRFGVNSATILTQPEVWKIAQAQFAEFEPLHVVFLRSLERDELAALEQELPETGVVAGLGGGQALDTAKYLAWKRERPLLLAPTIVSVDAAVTNTIAVREQQRVHYIGFCVADAIPVDLEIIAQAPRELNRAGVGDLLSIHTALWDWEHAGTDYDPIVAEQARAILMRIDERAGEIAACTDEALRLILESYVKENALCLQVGSSRPEEGSEHFLGYNLEYLSGRSFVHGQLICLCTYAMARLQANRPQWVRSLIERTRCPWRLSELGMSASCFIQALLTLRDYAEAEGFVSSVITQRPITQAFAEQLARECEA